MVRPFQFSGLPKILFKCGARTQLPSIIRQYGNEIIIVAGRNSFICSAAGERLFNEFNEKGIEAHLITVAGEPSPELIDNTVNKFRERKIDLVVGIGGGSVMDAGKAISAMMTLNEPVVEFLEGIGRKEHPGSTLPFVAVPTTSGTGSEATKNAVISKPGPKGYKRSLRHDNFVPDIALVDPELTLGCPREITAASGMDCFTQLVESYLSDKSGNYTDALALEGIIAIKDSLLKSYVDGSDIVARTGMSFAALTSGICLANAGLGVIHGFASSIGGMFDIPHGLICGTLMASGNEVNVKVLRRNPGNQSVLKKYSKLGRLFDDTNGRSDDYYIDSFISFLHTLTSQLNIPGLNKQLITESDIEFICSITEMKNNPVKLAQEDLKDILRSRVL